MNILSEGDFFKHGRSRAAACSGKSLLGLQSNGMVGDMVGKVGWGQKGVFCLYYLLGPLLPSLLNTAARAILQNRSLYVALLLKSPE